MNTRVGTPRPVVGVLGQTAICTLGGVLGDRMGDAGWMGAWVGLGFGGLGVRVVWRVCVGEKGFRKGEC